MGFNASITAFLNMMAAMFNINGEGNIGGGNFHAGVGGGLGSM